MKSLGVYKCVIIDDEVHALEGLKKYIQKCPELSLIGSYSDPILALSKLREFDSIDLILLDIDMPEINGIELSKLLRPLTFGLIFTTGYTKYGYEAFKVHADDYLLKPYSFIEFVASINRIFGQSKIPPPQFIKEKTFLVKSKEDNLRIFNLKYSEVIAVESKMNYVMIHTFNKKIITYITLQEISKVLTQQPGFMQFQRSFIISELHIESIIGNTIRMINGLEITVGSYYKKNFADFISDKLMKSSRR